MSNEFKRCSICDYTDMDRTQKKRDFVLDKSTQDYHCTECRLAIEDTILDDMIVKDDWVPQFERPTIPYWQKDKRKGGFKKGNQDWKERQNAKDVDNREKPKNNRNGARDISTVQETVPNKEEIKRSRETCLEDSQEARKLEGSTTPTGDHWKPSVAPTSGHTDPIHNGGDPLDWEWYNVEEEETDKVE